MARPPRKPGRSQARRRVGPGTWQWLPRLLRTLFVVVVISGSLGGAWTLLEWMKNPAAWPVRKVEIQGDLRHLARSRVRTLLEPALAGGFFSAPVARIQDLLLAEPWIARATVRRVWPDTLQVQLVEQRPVARWGEHGWLNPRGDVFTPRQPVAIEGLPRLDGPPGHARRVLRTWLELRRSLRRVNLDLAGLSLDRRRAWHARLSNGVRVELGRAAPLPRLARLVDVWQALRAMEQDLPAVVDMRYSNGLAVRRRETAKPGEHTG